MTDLEEPKFLKSPYFRGGAEWQIAPGAPREVVDEFNAWMKALDGSPTIPNPDEITAMVERDSKKINHSV